MFAWMASEENLFYMQTKSRCNNIFRRYTFCLSDFFACQVMRSIRQHFIFYSYFFIAVILVLSFIKNDLSFVLSQNIGLPN